MGSINLARVDQRLIHGQIMTAIAPSSGANSIIVANDTLASDDLMKGISESTGSSKGYDTKVLSLQDTIELWLENEFNNKNVLLITKTIEDMQKLINSGLPVKLLNIGGNAKKPGTIDIINEVSISKEEFQQLKQLNDDKDVDIYVQALPSNKKVTYSDVAKKFI